MLRSPVKRSRFLTLSRIASSMEYRIKLEFLQDWILRKGFRNTIHNVLTFMIVDVVLQYVFLALCMLILKRRETFLYNDK